jgi:hypothetical protein
MNCEQVQQRLSEYLDRLLDPAIHRTIEIHLAGCSPCRAEAELLAECIRRIAGLSDVEPPIGFAQRVVAHVKEIETKPRFWESLLLPLKFNLPMQATALVLVGIIAVYVFDPEPHMKRLAPSQQMFVPTETEGPSARDSTLARSDARSEKGIAETVQKPLSPLSPSAGDQAGTSLAQGEFARQRAAEIPQEQVPAEKEALGRELPVASRPAFSIGAEQRGSDPSITGIIQTPQKSKVTTPIPVVSEPKGFPLPAAPAAPRDFFSGAFGPSSLASERHKLAPAPDVEIIVRRRPQAANQDSKENTQAPAQAESGSAVREQTARSIDRLLLSLPESTTPQAVSLIIPQSQYERLKADLLRIGTIESESRVAVRDMNATSAPEAQLRVLLIVLPADDRGPTPEPGPNR